MQRVSVVGNSGSGKSTLSARLADRMGAPRIELDAIRHQAGWVELPDADFLREVDARTRAPRWVVDGNYPMVRDLVWSRADTVIWLDPPRHVAAGRVLMRTLRRLAFRIELWNGNRERWTNLLSLDPDRSVIVWAWTQHASYRATYSEAMRASSALRFERLADRADVERFLESIPEGGDGR